MSTAKGEKEVGGPATFHDVATDAARKMAAWVLENVAEVQTVFVGFDYGADLNESGVAAFTWQGREGPVKRVDQIVCSSRQAARLAGLMVARLREVTDIYTEQLSAVGEQLRKVKDAQQQEEAGGRG